MPRKKISDEFADESANLQDGETLVKTTTQTIRKETAKSDAEIITFEDADTETEPDNGELVETFPEGTLGNLVFSDQEEINNLQCNVLVVRKPDSAGEKFRVPNSSRLSYAPIRNVQLTTAQSDIEEQIRSVYGGGHYYLQIQIGNKIQTGWNADLADPHDAPAPVSVAIETPKQETKPLSLIEQAQQIKILKETLFGEELKERDIMKAEIEKLREELRKKDMDALTAKIEAIANKEPDDEFTQRFKLLQNVTDTSLRQKIIDSIVPDKTERGWLGEILDHKEEIAEVIKIGFGMFSGGAASQPTDLNALENMLKANTATPGNDTVTDLMPSNFNRRQPQTDSDTEQK